MEMFLVDVCVPKADLEGQSVQETPGLMQRAGFTMHGPVYAASYCKL